MHQNLRVVLLGLGVAAVGVGMSDALARVTVRALAGGGRLARRAGR